MDKYQVIVKNLGRRKVNLKVDGVSEYETKEIILKFCKRHLLSDEIYLMANGDIVVGWRKVGEFKIIKTN
ncbi:MAG: hypothetical protein IJO32_00470 [Bacilli bacterium]|nr:hypothetical protein [Bacilli bacterium]